MSRATLIYNPVAGRNPVRRGAEIRAAADALRADGFALDVQPTTGPESATGLARAAASQGAAAVIVCGGDGTINEVVNGLAGSECALAILPGGTANIAAKDLGLDHNPVRAAQALAHTRRERIALGRVVWNTNESNGDQESGQAEPGRYFLSVAGAGFDAYIVHALSWKFKTTFGVLAYMWEAVHQSLRYSFPSMICRMGDDEQHATLALFQRTERYAGWLHLVPGASLFRPQLKLCLFQGRGPWRYLRYAVSVALRRHLNHSDVRLIEGSPVACNPANGGGPVYVELDGELAGQLPATFEIVPDALTLLMPESAPRPKPS